MFDAHIVDDVNEAVRKVGHVLALDRGRVRRRFEERFTARRMAHDYLDIYSSLVRTRPITEGRTSIVVPAIITEAMRPPVTHFPSIHGIDGHAQGKPDLAEPSREA